MTGSPRDTWFFVYKAVAKNPSIVWETFYSDPTTQKQLKQFHHMYGNAKAKERIYEMFVNIKKKHGYEVVGEAVEVKKTESLKSQVEKAERDDKKVASLVERIVSKNLKNPRFQRRNLADNFSH